MTTIILDSSALFLILDKHTTLFKHLHFTETQHAVCVLNEDDKITSFCSAILTS